jgi:hypothetical protein
MHDELWRKIVILHNTNKSLFIWCEEHEVELNSFLQPNNEFKNAWEHVVRAKANEIGLNGEPNPEYQKATLEDALSHEYRAFFDICDWASVILRSRAIDLLKPYDQASISAAIPNYYSKMRPDFEIAIEKIAGLRGGKDIAQSGSILDRVEEYKAILVNLSHYNDIITQSVESLILAREYNNQLLALIKRVNDDLAPYDVDSIKEIIPNYWSEIRPNLEQNSNKLAAIVKAKGNQLVSDKECEAILSSVADITRKISQCIPSIAEYDTRKKSGAAKSWRKEFVYGVIVGGSIVGVITAAAFAYCDHLKDLLFPPKK